MKYQSNIHSVNHLTKSVLGRLEFSLRGFPYTSNDLLVLNLHSTPKWLIPELEKKLAFFSRFFNFVDSEFLNRFYSTSEEFSSNKPSLLLTFDDGLKNNLFAVDLMDKLNIKGLFFVVPAFFMESASNQENYYKTFIRKITNPAIDSTSDDFTAMNSANLKQLVQNGHALGSHSFSHSLANLTNPSHFEHELVESKRIIENETSEHVLNYCAPFNSSASTLPEHWKFIKQNYSYFHSTYPGSNAIDKNPYFIKRVNFEVFWKLYACVFAAGKYEWKRWEQQRNSFSKTIG